MRELWAVDLSGLEPRSVNAQARGRVAFFAAGAERGVINTSVFNKHGAGADHLTVRRNRHMGTFTVDEKKAAQVAEAMRHAVALCRERRK